MDEKQAKVHHKTKHRRGTSSRENRTEASPTKTTTVTTTTPIVIVQSQANDDEMAESPASSIINVNSHLANAGNLFLSIQNDLYQCTES